MEHSEFRIGQPFWCSGKKYRCTDFGLRTIIAIRLDQVEVVRERLFKETISYEQANREGWFKGPPYAIAEIVFDEDDLPACTLERT
jgi:hypothetical protein